MSFRHLIPALLLTAPHAFAQLPARAPATPAAPATETPAKPLSPEAMDKLLTQLEEIETSLQGKRSSYNRSLLPRLQEAGSNDDKAFSLWLEATKSLEFEANGKSATEFSDYRNGKAKELRGDPSFTTQLRLQCRFLALIVLQSEAETDAQLLEMVTSASAYLDDLVTSSKKITGKKDEIQRSAIDSVIARHLKLDVSARKKEGPAAYTPGSLSEIYHQMILPYYREKKAAAAIASAWTKRISQETTLVELNKVPEQLEKFQKERLPELKWGQAKDLYAAGQQEAAAASMVTIIKANLAHRQTAAWIKELSGLVRESANASTAAPVRPVPATPVSAKE